MEILPSPSSVLYCILHFPAEFSELLAAGRRGKFFILLQAILCGVCGGEAEFLFPLGGVKFLLVPMWSRTFICVLVPPSVYGTASTPTHLMFSLLLSSITMAHLPPAMLCTSTSGFSLYLIPNCNNHHHI